MPDAPTLTRTSSRAKRDPLIDVLRGVALLMIFVDHIPHDALNRVTLHDFGFCDAAEIFVLLAGFSSMLAYGRSFERDGTWSGLRRVALRCLRIYLAQIVLLLVTLGIVILWTRTFHMPTTNLAPVLGAPVSALAHGLTLRALPTYLDILPLYVVLLAIFPLIYLGLRRAFWPTLATSAAVWAAANIHHALNLPNWLDPHGWYFDPFAWQLLFTIGAALALRTAARGVRLPWHPALASLCSAYLVVAFLEAAPWGDWGLPNLSLFAMAPPEKSFLSWPRIIDILALMYLLMSALRIQAVARARVLRPIDACGRHSLEVFSIGCVLSLFGRLVLRTYGTGFTAQFAVNAIGFGILCAVGLWLDRGRTPTAAPSLTARPVGLLG